MIADEVDDKNGDSLANAGRKWFKVLRIVPAMSNGSAETVERWC